MTPLAIVALTLTLCLTLGLTVVGLLSFRTARPDPVRRALREALQAPPDADDLALTEGLFQLVRQHAEALARERQAMQDAGGVHAFLTLLPGGCSCNAEEPDRCLGPVRGSRSTGLCPCVCHRAPPPTADGGRS